ncbi:MAG: exodeoxyribonuclease V subunit alpha [Candidatus Binatia bacterium]
MIPTIESLRQAEIISPLDAHFALAMGRIAGEARPEVLLAAALVSRHVGHGHVCLDLARIAAHDGLVDDAGERIDVTWPSLEPWLDALRSSPAIGGGTAPTPMVLDSAGRLYLRRYWAHQEGLAAAIRARATEVEATLDSAWLRRTLDRLFPVDPGTADRSEPDWQRVAALLAARRRFCVISGGPGTGKTYTVVKILALLVEQQQARRPGVPLRVVLVAPTGKAAARMAESIQRAKTTLPCSEEVRRLIPEDAKTIHRCLGSRGGSSTDFRHNAENPLLADAVLVDEASMVDLALMRRLVDAVPPAARLILLGDKDQLASVEAGAVLGDICNTGAPRSYSRPLVAEITEPGGGCLALEPRAPATTGIWDCMVQLTRSYRYGPRSGIGQLARAINDGDTAAALDILAADRYPDVSLVETPTGQNLSLALETSVIAGFDRYLRLHAPEDRLRGLEHFRVLCAHRRGPCGVEVVNRQIEDILAGTGLIQPEGRYYAGRPIIVTRNDYQLNLFNGDVGLLVDADGKKGDGALNGTVPGNGPEGTRPRTESGHRMAVFLGPGGALRRLSPSRLPAHETVFALSVHKSQGSEFDEVAVLLPPRPSPVLSRELLYTAVTRARQRVTIHATREVVEYAIAHRIDRTSGLRDALWAGG